jgi:hypothetical protein
MKFMSESECNRWLKAADLPSPSDNLPERFAFESAYRLPGDAGKKTAIARMLISVIDDDEPECCLWVTGYGIWPSSENQNLYYTLRKSFGDSRRLREASGHLFGNSEKDQLECFLDLVLYFSWDAAMYLPKSSTIVSMSHDESIEVHCSSASEFVDITKKVETLGLEEV